MSRLRSVFFFCALSLLVSGAAEAQLAPTPKSAPRTPVKKETLSSKKPSLPPSRTLEGAATVLDGERLRLGGHEVRLFGVVPPLLSAPMGPQARAVLDVLARGNVTCRVRDRDKDGKLFASCRNEAQADFAVELLRRGLAVTARGTLHASELALTYISAEEAARSQHLGLWSIAQPPAASSRDIEKEALKLEAFEPPTKAEEPAQKDIAAQTVAEPQKDAAGEDAPSVPPIALDFASDERAFFFEKYQLLMTGLLFLFSAIVFAGSFVFVKKQERKDSLRAIAAALRGELMAARAVCLARLSKIAHEQDGNSVSWPRIRALVFQAYLPQLGRLGADLARQVSSIYGQASDYASYYVGAEGRPDAASKKQSLQTLVHHIEEVVPRLAEIERGGAASRLVVKTSAQALFAQPAAAKEIDTPALPQIEAAEPLAQDEAVAQEAVEEEESVAQEPVEEEAPFSPLEGEEESPIAPQETEALEAQEPVVQKEPPPPPAGNKKKKAARRAEKTEPPVEQPAPEDPSRGTAEQESLPREKRAASAKQLDMKTPLSNKFSQAKGFAAQKWAVLKEKALLSDESFEDNTLPDYAHLTEEEMEALAYADDYLYALDDAGKKKKDKKTG